MNKPSVHWLYVIVLWGILPHISLLSMAEVTLNLKVNLDQAIPANPVIVVDRTIEHCGKEIIDNLVVGKINMVANCLIWIELDPTLETEQRVSSTSRDTPLLLQAEKCQFKTRVISCQLNTYINIKSNDNTVHNPHGWLNGRTVFNRTLMHPNREFKRKLKATGIYKVSCDTHTWMKAYIGVFDHPYYGVSDLNGELSIPEIPKGHHMLRLWHEVLGEYSFPLKLEAGGRFDKEIELVFKDTRKPEEKHPTKAPWP